MCGGHLALACGGPNGVVSAVGAVGVIGADGGPGCGAVVRERLIVALLDLFDRVLCVEIVAGVFMA